MMIHYKWYEMTLRTEMKSVTSPWAETGHSIKRPLSIKDENKNKTKQTNINDTVQH